MSKKRVILCIVAAIALIAIATPAIAYRVKDNPLGTTEYFHDVARDNVWQSTLIHNFGRNSDVDSGEDIWDGGGTWAAPTQERLHNITSSLSTDSGSLIRGSTASGGSTTTLIDNSATFVTSGVSTGDLLVNDTQDIYGIISAFSETGLTVYDMVRDDTFKSGNTEFTNNQDDAYRVITEVGSGATAVLVEGLDEDWNVAFEIVRLRGTDNNATTTTFRMINKMVAIHSGSGTNTGNISATAQTDSTVTSQINIGNNVTHSSVYQIPAGKRGYITRWNSHLNVTQSSLSNNVRLLIKPIGQGFQTRSLVALSGTGADVQREFDGGLLVPSLGIVKLSMSGAINNIDISSSFDLVIENN